MIIFVAGYSYKTNQYGLTIDTVTAFELVKPDGNVVMVTKTSNPNLFFGLKVRVLSDVNMILTQAFVTWGGFNNLVDFIFSIL